MKTIVIIEDHPIFRQGLKGTITELPEYEVIGECATAREGLRMVRKLRPDIAIVDLRLPDGDGITLTEKIRAESGHTRVMIVSGILNARAVKRGAEAGALGFMSKDSGSDCLLKCLGHMAAGKPFFDRDLSDELHKLFPAADGKGGTFAGHGQLTPREQEIMQLIAEGRSAKDISDRLCISPSAVRSHKANIRKKTGTRTEAELIRYAMKTGLTGD